MTAQPTRSPEMQAWLDGVMPIQRQLLALHRGGQHGPRYYEGDPACPSCLFRKARWPIEPKPQPRATMWSSLCRLFGIRW